MSSRRFMPGSRLSIALVLALSACTSGNIATSPSEAPSLARAARTYRAVDLGTLPGGDFSAATAINNSGQIVGQASTATGERHAVLWSGGAITDLGTLGGSVSQALGINNAGVVVGFSETAAGPGHAFLWSRRMTDLGTLGGAGAGAVDINAGGQVLLGGDDGSIGIWHRGAITPLTLPAGSSGCTPVAINSAGRVIAQCGIGQDIRSILWTRNGPTDLGTLGGTITAALAINASGRVVGIGRQDPDVGSRPFLWVRGEMIELSTRGMPIGVVPTAINAGGAIAGQLGIADQLQALVWDGSTTVSLAGAPGEDTYVFDLNAAGEAVGQTVAGNQIHATLWTPR